MCCVLQRPSIFNSVGTFVFGWNSVFRDVPTKTYKRSTIRSVIICDINAFYFQSRYRGLRGLDREAVNTSFPHSTYPFHPQHSVRWSNQGFRTCKTPLILSSGVPPKPTIGLFATGKDHDIYQTDLTLNCSPIGIIRVYIKLCNTVYIYIQYHGCQYRCFFQTCNIYTNVGFP